ncbi:hypothetical protein JNB_02485 [Janibacter sp. HTCC2649]|nr:hypothetical protein JNB_02485 [Janibacter sp. HTCC2649]
MLAFSLTMPLTRLAVESLPPLFVGAGRAVVASLAAGAALLLTRQGRPRGTQWWRLAIVAGGIVIGFPLLTSYALTTAPASHGAVVIALLPAATATVAVLRTGERPPLRFWLALGAATVAAMTFAVAQAGGIGAVHTSDALFFLAVLAAAVGYAEGGLLARELGAWQTVSWALVLSAPVMAVLTVVSADGSMPRADFVHWLAFAYLGLVSMFLGFVAWYRGLAIGPMASVSQVQLVQPLMSIAWAALLLGEQITPGLIATGVVVVLAATAAVRVRLGSSSVLGDAVGVEDTGDTADTADDVVEVTRVAHLEGELEARHPVA